MDRKKKILSKIDIGNSVGLELGPLHQPILTKGEAKVLYADHMSAEELRKKYAGHDLPMEKIVDPDYVLGDKSLKQTIKNKKFDYVVASHVIEHIPNTVAWLQDVASVLKPGGILSLVIPDMRYTFDIARDLSRTSDVVGAYIDGINKSNSSMIYDAISEFKEITPQQAWIGLVKKALNGASKKEIDKAWQLAHENLEPGSYIDAHCYTYTPASFLDILRRLMYHELIDFEVAGFKETVQNELEFFVSLRKISGKRNVKEQLSTLPRIPSQPRFNKLLFQNNNLKLENTKLKQQLNDSRQELENMKSSKSWSVTRPLREISLSLTKVRNDK